MGCSFSKRKSSGRVQAVTSPQARNAPTPLGRRQPTDECSGEVADLLASLRLEDHAKGLRSLGVCAISDIGDLHVEDLEEAGLTRVQVRQLQRAALPRQQPRSSSTSDFQSPQKPMSARHTAPAGGFCTSPTLAARSQDVEQKLVGGQAGAAAQLKEQSLKKGSSIPAVQAEMSQKPAKDGVEQATPLLGGEASTTDDSLRTEVLSFSGDIPLRGAEWEQEHSLGQNGGLIEAKALGADRWQESGNADAGMASQLPAERPRSLGAGGALEEISQLESTILPSVEVAPAPRLPPGIPRAPIGSRLSSAVAAGLVACGATPSLGQEDQEKRLLANSNLEAASEIDDIEETLHPAPRQVDSGIGPSHVGGMSSPFRAPPRVDDTEETLLPSEQSRGPASSAPDSGSEEDEDPLWGMGGEPPEDEIDVEEGHYRRGNQPSVVQRRPASIGRAHPKQINKELGKLLDDSPFSGDSVGSSMPDALKQRLERRAQERSRKVMDKRGEEPAEALRADTSPGGPRPDARARAATPQQQSARGNTAEPGGHGRGAAKPSADVRSHSEGPGGEKGGRQMFDKNELRFSQRELFVDSIGRYRARQDQKAMAIRARSPSPEVAVCPARQHKSLRIFARKRPLSQEESIKRREFDIATVLSGRPFPTQLTLHNCLFQADLKTPFINHLQFEFDHVFSEETQNQEVYRLAAFDLVLNTREGGTGTMFMFGQTGSGKTHTMAAIEEMAAKDLFEGATPGSDWIDLQFVELRGNRCFDLLAPGPKEKMPELKVREQKDGSYFAEGATSLTPKGPEELCSMVRTAHARRATSATEANSVSSRSHALCTVRLLKSKGQLTLADCAGTERRKDSMYHSKERQVEAAEINASLHALKECVRYAAQRERVPAHAYRASALTKLLSGAFSRGDASQLAVVCTLSPCASDTEHTLSTLRTGMSLGDRGAEKEEKEQLVVRRAEEAPPPDKWDPSQVRAWLTELSNGEFKDVATALPTDFTGKMLVRVPESRFIQLCGGNERKGQKLFALLRERIRERGR